MADNIKTKTEAKTKKQRIITDVALIILLAVIAGGAYFFWLFSRNAGAYAVVYIDGEEVARYPLDTNIEVTFSTYDGRSFNTLVIRDGKADVTDAGCPDRICVNMRSISFEGETITCLPNKLVVKIEGGESPGVDLP
ncbi:MAG TPA: NusG domain II-containing protein [Bacillota bacterium]|nr:NusG domain II-containing protein [Clostridiales bacterium]HOQ14581.1 NusG domain II-containing protein [Bacillota bacterium]HPU17976.1 NusG domain II-containing protein [Bacillota bacterium]